MTNTNETKGAKFNRNLSTKEIASLGRTEIKAMIKSGALPEGLKVSIRFRSFSGGSSIDVTVVAVPFAVMNPERLHASITDPHAFVPEYTCPRHRPEATALLNKISSVFSAYNRDASDSMTDYFDVNFYGGRASFDSDIESAERDAYAALVAELPLPVAS